MDIIAAYQHIHEWWILERYVEHVTCPRCDYLQSKCCLSCILEICVLVQIVLQVIVNGPSLGVDPALSKRTRGGGADLSPALYQGTRHHCINFLWYFKHSLRLVHILSDCAMEILRIPENSKVSWCELCDILHNFTKFSTNLIRTSW